MKKILPFFIFFVVFFHGQNLDLKVLETQISKNNKAGKQEISQYKLLQILSNKDLSQIQQCEVNLLLATTFRSINDYSSAINYLKKAENISSNIIGEDSLKMNIKAEMAFAYFDSQKYDRSSEIIEFIKKENYQNLDPTNHAYIIMQEGYINFLHGKYLLSENLYEESLALIKKSSSCDQPVVMVKQMQLNAALNNFTKVDEIYKSSINIANSCAIIKYKIYATEEIKAIYEKKKDQNKVFAFGETLDSLKNIYDRDSKSADMHVSNQNYLEKETETEKKNFIFILIIAIILGIALSIWGFIYFKKNKTHAVEKSRFEEELKNIKKELQIYSEAQFSQTKTENTILNSEKLNNRQKELLEFVAKGFSNREIAEKFSITEATVKYHLGNIYSILDIKNRKEIFGKILDKK